MPAQASRQTLFIALAVASLVVVEGVVIVGGRLAEDALELRRHTHESLIAISQVNERKDHTESLVREFVLTGNEPLAVRAEKNFTEAHRRVAHARQLMGENTNQVRRLDRLEATLKELTGRWTTTLAARRTQGVASAEKLVAEGIGRRLTDEAEFLLDEMAAEEKRLLAERSTRAARYSDLCNHAVKAGGVLTVLFGFLAVRELRRQSRARELAALHLEHLHRRQELVFNSVGDGLHGLDMDGTINFQNAAAERMLGLTKGEVLGRPAHATVHHHHADGSEYPVANCPIYATLQDGRTRTLRDEVFWRKDGTCFPVEYVVSPVTDSEGQQLGAIVAFRDVTERQKAEAALRASEESLAVTLHSIGDAVLSTDAKGCVTRLNLVAEQLTGWSHAEALGRPVAEVFNIINESTRQPAFLPVAETLAKGTIHGLANHTILIARDGTERPIADSCAPIRDRAGEVIGAVLVFRDVSEEKAAEARQRTSESRFRALVSASARMIWRSNARGEITEPIPDWENFVGQPPGESVKNNWGEFVHPEDLPRLQTEFCQGTAGTTTFTMEFRTRRHDGVYRNLVSLAAPVLDAEGRVREWIGSLNDVTEKKSAETELRRAATAIAAMQDAVFIFAADTLRFFSVNEGAQRQVGYSREELLTMTPLSINPECTEAQFRAMVAPLLDGREQVLKFTTNHRHKDGTDVPVEINLQMAGEGAERCFVALCRDVAERERAEAEIIEKNRALSELKAALDSHAIVAITDARGKITYVNDKFCAISKYSREELIGQDHRIINSGHHGKDFFRNLWETITSGRTWKGEIKNRAKDGSPYWVDTTIVPFLGAGGKPTQFIAIRADISERKLVEETLRQALTELSRANAELDEASRHKDEFLANMSHELRTPLNAILGLSEALLEQVSGTLTPRQVKSVTTISTSGQHLLALINDILDLSKIEAGRLELHIEPIKVDEFCQSCLVFVKTQAMQKQIYVDHQRDARPLVISADPKRLKQILVNLLTNAVKFTPQGGRIGLSVSAPEGEDVMRFSVWDTGVGIAAEDQAKLFQAFTQVDSGLNRAQEGTGLGLALVAKLVELHGGSVSLESEPGKGSRFTVTLPLPASGAGVPPAAAPSANAGGTAFLRRSAGGDVAPAPVGAGEPLASPQPFRRALVIEDDPTAGEQLVHYLTLLGMQSALHVRGAESIQAALRAKPDVILLDIQLPDESGWVELAKLKEHPATRDIPVAVVSVVDEPEKSLSMGAVAHFTKPCTREQLAGFLNRPYTPKPEPVPRPMPKVASSGPTILLAEDNEANIQTVGGYLADKGYAMTYAMNGMVAVKLARELRPALILMDIQMPMMDGLTAIKEIRAEAALKEIPIIALTALAMSGDRERCIAAGATDYMSKPVKLKELAGLVERLLKQEA